MFQLVLMLFSSSVWGLRCFNEIMLVGFNAMLIERFPSSCRQVVDGGVYGWGVLTVESVKPGVARKMER